MGHNRLGALAKQSKTEGGFLIREMFNDLYCIYMVQFELSSRITTGTNVIVCILYHTNYQSPNVAIIRALSFFNRAQIPKTFSRFVDYKYDGFLGPFSLNSSECFARHGSNSQISSMSCPINDSSLSARTNK